MTESTPHDERTMERLLRSLEGIVSARVLADAIGRPDEIHILSTPDVHPKQVVRNVESALSAGLGVVVDRRIVSVAQMRTYEIPELPDPDGDELEAGDVVSQDGAPAPSASPAPTAAAQLRSAREPIDNETAQRFVYVGYEAKTQGSVDVSCRVTVRLGRTSFSGESTGAATPLGRAQAAARALFGAVANAREVDSFALEDVGLLQAHGRGFVLVAAQALQGRATHALTGVASMGRSPEEAAVLASLHALNRWAELDS